MTQQIQMLLTVDSGLIIAESRLDTAKRPLKLYFKALAIR